MAIIKKAMRLSWTWESEMAIIKKAMRLFWTW